jgi:hypothetical protein
MERYLGVIRARVVSTMSAGLSRWLFRIGSSTGRRLQLHGLRHHSEERGLRENALWNTRGKSRNGLGSEKTICTAARL